MVKTVNSINIPIPASFVAVLFTALGFQFGRAFGKKLDQSIQASKWFKNLKKSKAAEDQILAWLVPRLLDFLHHWWIGALIMIFAPARLGAYWGDLAYWFGFGLFVDDFQDIPRRFRGYFTIPEELVEG